MGTWGTPETRLAGSPRPNDIRNLMQPPARLRLALLLALFCSWAIAPLAHAGPGLDEIVAQWSQGSFRSPLMCELEGRLVRGVRRVLIRAQPMPGRPPQMSIEFIDIQPGTATRCIDATGSPVPNLVGKLQLKRPAHRHPETAKRDFKRMLGQDKGFSYSVSSGRLKIQPVASPPAKAVQESFEGGTVTLSLIFPATDAERALAEFRSERKLLLTLESPAGKRILLPLFDPAAQPRPAR